MFGPLGVPELIFILVLALLIFGPRKLPEIGRTLGRGMAEFRKASSELKRSLDAEMIREEMRQSDPRNLLRESPAASPDKPPETSSAKVESPLASPPATVARGSEVAEAATPMPPTDPADEAKSEPEKR